MEHNIETSSMQADNVAAAFHRSGRVYQQLPPSIPNPSSRRPNSTYQSLSTRFPQKTILKGFPSKSIRCSGLKSNRLIIRVSRKPENKKKKEKRKRHSGKGVRMIASYRLQSEALRSYGYLSSRRVWKSRTSNGSPTKVVETKKRERAREGKREERKIEKKRRRREHRVCVACGASPFLIESRLRAYILSSIGAVGSVSAAKRVETVTRGCRLGRRWRETSSARVTRRGFTVVV